MYVISWALPRRDHWLSGVTASVVAAGMATVGGTLGGSLAFDDQLISDPTRSDHPGGAPEADDQIM